MAGQPLRRVCVSRPGALAALATEGPVGLELHLANLTSEVVQVRAEDANEELSLGSFEARVLRWPVPSGRH
jgi:hypothetical protein